jgi:hypothetical protein
MKKFCFWGLLAILLVLTGCPEPMVVVDPEDGNGKEGGEEKEVPPLEKEVVFEMEFNDDNDWANPGNENWSRWQYDLKYEDNSFDLSSMLTDKKVYTLTYSFSTNVNIDELTTYFYNMDTVVYNWQTISNYVTVKQNIEKGKEYTGKIVYIPTSTAAGLLPKDTGLRFDAHNRKVNTTAVIYFYQFDLELVDKEVSLETWTVSGKDFTINAETFAETLSDFKSKSNVLHIKPSYDLDDYGDFVMQYDLNDYKGKTIEIKMEMDVYLTKDSWITWQINSSPTPFYPVVCGAVSESTYQEHTVGPALTANVWNHLKGSYIYTVPNTEPTDDNGKQLYLSGMQIAGAEAYFANASITIKEPNKMTFTENSGYLGGNDWDRWEYDYREENNLFDFSAMLAGNKVYIFSYSFTSDIAIDQFGCYFYNCGEPDWDWKMISNWEKIAGNTEANKNYSGKVVFIPSEEADGCSPDITYFKLGIRNRDVDTPATISFYEFSLEEKDKEISLETWTVSGGEEFKINPGTSAKILPAYESKSDVLHIKPSYGFDEYTDFLMQYDLNSYKGQKIEITLSMDVYLKTPSWIAWQINSTPTPFYPVVCGAVSESTYPEHTVGPALTANTWHTITGTYTYTVPNTESTDDNGKQLYLSGMQIAGAEVYFANASITIKP